MQCINNPEKNETISKILEEMNYAEQFLLNWKAYWYEKYENIILPEKFSLMPSDAQEELGLNMYTHFIKHDKKGTLIPIKSVEVGNKYEICTVEWNGITTNKCSRRMAFNSDGNITLEKDKRDFSKRKLDYTCKYNVVNGDFDIKLVEVLKEKEIIYPQINCSTVYIEKKGNILTKTTKKGTHIEFRYNLLSGEKSIYIYTKKASGKVNGIYKLDIKDSKIGKITFYSRKGNKQELTNDNNCEQLNILLKALRVNGLSNILFNQIENQIDSLVKEIISELPIKSLVGSINNNYKINSKQQSSSRKENAGMLKDLVNITNEEIEESAQKAVESGPYITDNGDYYAAKLCKINLGAASCEAIINDKTPFPEGVYRPAEPCLVKVKRKTK